MLPLQVTLEGFMSYRDTTTINFDGASLWMLSGANGAGKSTVFDAMRWALFGAHRGGQQGQEALIHHDKVGLRVEFDFALGADIFRISRTLARGGRSTRQVFYLGGPNPPRPGAPLPQSVPETDMVDGFRKWVENVVGLSDTTFTSAVLLQQGRADALLSAENSVRHQLLSEIVDLSAYERLHDLAVEKARQTETEARLLQSRYDATDVVDEIELATAVARVEELGQAQGETQKGLEEMLRLQPEARRWVELGAARDQETGEREHLQDILGQAEVITRDATRARELETWLPELTLLHKLRTRQAQQLATAESAGRKLKLLTNQIAALQGDVSVNRELATQARTELEAAETARAAAWRELSELSPALQEVNQLAENRQRLGALDVELAKYSPDLDAHIAAASRDLEAAREARSVVPILGRYVKSRNAYRKGNTAIEAAYASREKTQQALHQAQNDLENRKADVADREADLQEIRAQVTKSSTLLQQVQAARTRFEDIAGAANCYYCGQELTPAHRQQEQRRLDSEFREATQAHEAARHALREAQTAHTNAITAQTQAERLLETTREKLERARIEVQRVEQETRAQGEAALVALGELPPAFAAHFGHVSLHEAELELLELPYPAKDDYEAIREVAAQVGPYDLELQDLERQRQERDTRRGVRAPLAQQVVALESRYGAESEKRLRADFARAQRESATGETRLKTARTGLQSTEAALRNAETSLDAATREQGTLQVALAGAEAALEEIERELENRQQAAPPALKTYSTAPVESMEMALEAWRQEWDCLDAAVVTFRAQELATAQERAARIDVELERITREIEAIPAEARRSPTELKAEEKRLREQSTVQSSELAAAETHRSSLVGRQAERSTLAQSLHESQSAVRRQRLLADLLGRDALQRHLLQEAETSIVDAANDVLDRISGGTLRLELRRGEDEVAGARKGIPKVLDLVAYHSRSGERPAPQMVAFLSGSQRFRVAVALALGIGYYATRAAGGHNRANRVEAVIIDEGFGSLDKQGRNEMIEELQTLGSQLKRIILVSHQEDFAEAFTNRYLVELVDGSSQVTLQTDY